MRPAGRIEAHWWRRFYGVWAVVAVAFGSIEATSQLMEAARAADPLPPVGLTFVNELTGPLALLALVPAIKWFDDVFPFRPGAWPVALAAHLAFTVPLAMVHVALFVALRELIHPLLGADYRFGELRFELLYEYRKSALGYTLALFSLYGFRHYVTLRRLLDLPDAHERDAPAPGEDPQPDPFGAEAPRPGPVTRRFLARRGARDVIVNVADIRYVEAAGNYAVLHTELGELKLRQTLAALERELAPWDFVRVHRSYLVNLAAVREVQPWFHGDQRLVLTDGTLLNLSRRYRDALRQRTAATPIP